MRALELSTRLRLDSRQAASLEAMLLEEGADGVLEIPAVVETWVKANLTPEQTQAYNRYLESTRQGEAEAQALAEVHKMAQAVELSEEQRDGIISKKYDQYLQFNIYSSLVFTSPIIERQTTKVAITESRIEMPVFSTRRVSDGLLTEEQAQAYGEFKRKERELEELKAQEQD